jgi:hypothetical protein
MWWVIHLLAVILLQRVTGRHLFQDVEAVEDGVVVVEEEAEDRHHRERCFSQVETEKRQHHRKVAVVNDRVVAAARAARPLHPDLHPVRGLHQVEEGTTLMQAQKKLLVNWKQRSGAMPMELEGKNQKLTV